MSLIRSLSFVFLPLLSAGLLAQTPGSPAAATAAQQASGQQLPLSDEMAERIKTEGIEHSQVHRILDDMTGKIGHRLTGSDNFTKACEWAKGEFEAMGLAVELEEWGEWKTIWNRGRWHGRVLQPVRIDMYVATEAWTAGTGGLRSGGFVLAPRSDGDVEVEAVKGKWVIARRKPSKDVCAAVEEAGALGVVYRAGDPNKQYPLRVRVFGNSRVAQMELEDVPTLPEIAVRSDNFDELFAMVEDGKNPIAEFDIENTFQRGPIVLHNVIATLPGTEKPDEMVIVSSHLDSWHQAQGATDNGTGSATTLEAARILSKIGAKPKRTIKFCLWGGEEQGLLGSRGFVRRHRADMDKVSAAFNHDTGTNWAQSLRVTAAMHQQLEPVFAQVNRLLTAPDADFDGPVFDLRITERISGGGGSDHASFIAAKVPGLSWGLKGRSDYFQHTWHTQWDLFKNTIEEYQRHTATVIAMAALGTANLDQLLDRKGVEPGRGRTPQSATIVQGLFGAELDGLAFKTVKADGWAAKSGILKGDTLKKVNGQDIETLRQIFQIARNGEGDSVKFTLQRGEKTFEAVMKKSDMPQRRRRGR